jgi:hypothetical protein
MGDRLMALGGLRIVQGVFEYERVPPSSGVVESSRAEVRTDVFPGLQWHHDFTYVRDAAILHVGERDSFEPPPWFHFTMVTFPGFGSFETS